MFHAPRPITPPPPPTVDQARLAAEQDDQLALRRDRAATFVARPQDRLTGAVATRLLTGQGG